MLRGTRPESHYSWVALLHGLNGAVPYPGAVDSGKGRPPTSVAMNGSSTLTSTVPWLQLVVRHVPVHNRYKLHLSIFTEQTTRGKSSILNFNPIKLIVGKNEQNCEFWILQILCIYQLLSNRNKSASSGEGGVGIQPESASKNHGLYQ